MEPSRAGLSKSVDDKETVDGASVVEKFELRVAVLQDRESLERHGIRQSKEFDSRESLDWDNAFFTSDGVLDPEELCSIINKAIKDKRGSIGQMKQVLEPLESMKLPEIGNDGRYNLRNSLTWDKAFFTSAGVLEPEELASIIYKEVDNRNFPENREQELQFLESPKLDEKVGSRRYNVRQSLAWDNAFFTNAGVLEPEELSCIIKGVEKDGIPLLPQIKEEVHRSTESLSTMGDDSLESFESDLFEDLRASVQRSNKLQNKVYSEVTTRQINSGVKVDATSGNKMKPEIMSRMGTDRTQVLEKSTKKFVGRTGASLSKVPSIVGRTGSTSTPPTKSATMSADNIKKGKYGIANIVAPVLKRSSSSGSCGSLATHAVSRKSLTKIELESPSSSLDSLKSDLSDKIGDSRLKPVRRKVGPRAPNSPSSVLIFKTPSRTITKNKVPSANSRLSTNLKSVADLSPNLSHGSSTSGWSSESSSSNVAVKRRSTRLRSINCKQSSTSSNNSQVLNSQDSTTAQRSAENLGQMGLLVRPLEKTLAETQTPNHAASLRSSCFRRQSKFSSREVKSRNTKRGKEQSDSRVNKAIQDKRGSIGQMKQVLEPLESMKLPEIGNDGRYNLRNSLTWDKAFFTSAGVLEPEELASIIYKEVDNRNFPENREQELQFLESPKLDEKVGSRRYNVRQSLAWDNAFFTNAGVLEPEELSCIIKGVPLLPQIKEEVHRSTESLSTMGDDSLESFESDLFEDLRASVQRSNKLQNKVYSEVTTRQINSGVKVNATSGNKMKPEIMSRMGTDRTQVLEKSTKKFVDRTGASLSKVPKIVGRTGSTSTPPTKSATMSADNIKKEKDGIANIVAPVLKRSSSSGSCGSLATHAVSRKSLTKIELESPSSSLDSLKSNLSDKIGDSRLKPVRRKVGPRAPNSPSSVLIFKTPSRTITKNKVQSANSRLSTNLKSVADLSPNLSHGSSTSGWSSESSSSNVAVKRRSTRLRSINCKQSSTSNNNSQVLNSQDSTTAQRSAENLGQMGLLVRPLEKTLAETQTLNHAASLRSSCFRRQSKFSSREVKSRNTKRGKEQSDSRVNKAIQDKRGSIGQMKQVLEPLESMKLPEIGNDGRYNLRNSLTWDKAFFTSAGVLEPEELASIIYKEVDNRNFPENREQELQFLESPKLDEKVGSRRYNVRQSLAWDNAFFTSAGVLEPEELSCIIKGVEKDGIPLLPQIKEEVHRSTESLSTMGDDSLESFETDLFEDLRASVQRSNKLQNKVYSEVTTCQINSGVKVDATSGNKMKPEIMLRMGTDRTQVLEKSTKKFVGRTGASLSKAPNIVGRTGSTSTPPTKSATMSADNIKNGKDGIANIVAPVLKRSSSSGSCGSLAMHAVSRKSFTKIELESPSSSLDSLKSNLSDKIGDSRLKPVRRKVGPRAPNSPSSVPIFKTPSRTITKNKVQSANSRLSTNLKSVADLSPNLSHGSSTRGWSSESSSSNVAVKRRSTRLRSINCKQCSTSSNNSQVLNSQDSTTAQ